MGRAARWGEITQVNHSSPQKSMSCDGNFAKGVAEKWVASFFPFPFFTFSSLFRCFVVFFLVSSILFSFQLFSFLFVSFCFISFWFSFLGVCFVLVVFCFLLFFRFPPMVSVSLSEKTRRHHWRDPFCETPDLSWHIWSAFWILVQEREQFDTLVATYCTLPRDTISNTPMSSEIGFVRSQHKAHGATSSPSKRGISQYMSDTP